jgi:Domain of unknown function DUF29
MVRNMSNLYEQDCFRWFADQAQCLRAGQWSRLDCEHLEDSDVSARLLAAGETRLPQRAFPVHCPFSLEQLLDEHFWPQASAA